MHPDLYPLASELVRERRSRAARHLVLLPQPRPPGRIRRRTAHLLIGLAAHLTEEPVVVLPGRRRSRLVRGA